MKNLKSSNASSVFDNGFICGKSLYPGLLDVWSPALPTPGTRMEKNFLAVAQINCGHAAVRALKHESVWSMRDRFPLTLT